MRSGRRWRLHAVLGSALLCVMVVGASAWGALALYHAGNENALVRHSLAGAFAICGAATAVAVAVRRARGQALLAITRKAIVPAFQGLLSTFTRGAVGTACFATDPESCLQIDQFRIGAATEWAFHRMRRQQD